MHFNAGYLIKEYLYLFDVVVFLHGGLLRDDAVAGRCQKRGAQQAKLMWEGNLRASRFRDPSFLKCQEEPCRIKMTGDDALEEILSVCPSCCSLQRSVMPFSRRTCQYDK